MRLIKRVIIIWLFVEILAGFMILFVIPDNILLKWYLPSQSIVSTQAFLDKQAYLVPDEITGWRNKSDVNRENWVLDQYGSRAHKPVSLLKQKNKRVMFLGNSMINGGTHITNQQTLSAYIEDDNIEAVNFGVMLYSLDQSLLLYRHHLKRFKPDTIVVGLDADPVSGLKNIYIPFRSRQEVNMPYVKPRFVRGNRDIQLIKPELAQLKLFWRNGFSDNIKKRDAYYKNYQLYKLNFLPALSVAGFVISKFQSLLGYYKQDDEGEKLLISVMQKMVDEAEQDGAKLIFVIIPGRASVKPSKIRSLLPDKYAGTVKLINDAGFNLLDAKTVFLRYKNDLGRYYASDNAHLSAEGNLVLAEYIRRNID